MVNSEQLQPGSISVQMCVLVLFWNIDGLLAEREYDIQTSCFRSEWAPFVHIRRLLENKLQIAS